LSDCVIVFHNSAFDKKKVLSKKVFCFFYEDLLKK